MKRALFIASLLPPGGGGGVQRPTKFLKYLPEFGWESDCLTTNPPRGYPEDKNLASEIPEHTKIYYASRLPCFKMFGVFNKIGLSYITKTLVKTFSLPDEYVNWILPGIIKGMILIAENKYNVIFATAPAFSTLIIGKVLASYANLPLVVDLRDDWATNKTINHLTTVHSEGHKFLEYNILSFSKKIIVTSPLTKNHYNRLFSADKVEMITNGYDSSDFDMIKSVSNKDKLVFTFSGTIYKGLSPLTFLQAIDELLEENKISPDRIEVNFIGKIWAYKDAIAERKYVSTKGYIPHKDVIAEILRSDVLLLFMEYSLFAISGKIFEYFAAGKDILGLLPKNNALSVLEPELSKSMVVEWGDIKSIKMKIMEYYNGFTENKLPLTPFPKGKLKKYQRRELTSNLASIFNKVTGC